MELYKSFVPEQLAKIKELVGEEKYNSGKYELAAKIFDELVTSESFTEFLTLPAYEHLN